MTYHVILYIPENNASVENVRFEEGVHQSVGIVPPFVIRSDISKVDKGVDC